ADAYTTPLRATDVADNSGGSATASASTSSVIDATPSITATISGTAQEGQTLTAVVSGAEGDDILSYSWTSGTTVLGTDSTYLVQEGDGGARITLTVPDVAHNRRGSATAPSTTLCRSDATPSITATISGTAQEGQTLTAVVSGAEGDDILSYSWTSGTTVLGTDSTYLVQEGD